MPKKVPRFLFSFTEPDFGGPYEKIVWYKGTTNGSGRIVFVNNSVPEGQPLYYNDYCSGRSPCETSSKGELNPATGEFVIHSVDLTDDDYYYYDFYVDGGSSDTGLKYEINLTVSGKRFCQFNKHSDFSQEDYFKTNQLSKKKKLVGTKYVVLCFFSLIKYE